MAAAGRANSPPLGTASTSFSVIRGRFVASDGEWVMGFIRVAHAECPQQDASYYFPYLVFLYGHFTLT